MAPPTITNTSVANKVSKDAMALITFWMWTQFAGFNRPEWCSFLQQQQILQLIQEYDTAALTL
jgi:hypothetical protein